MTTLPARTPTSTMTFEDTAMDVYDFDGQRWLKGGTICTPLGINPDTIDKILQRHADEFGRDELRYELIETRGGPQTVRLYSARGAYLIAMLANSDPAKRFRKWVLDVLLGMGRGPALSIEPMLDAAQLSQSVCNTVAALQHWTANDYQVAAGGFAEHLSCKQVARLVDQPLHQIRLYRAICVAARRQNAASQSRDVALFDNGLPA